jgi:peroxiredoxin
MAKRKIDIISVDTGGAVGDKVFDFNRCGVDSKSVRMADVLADGEYLLLDFWASWCQPCLQQIPDVQRAYEKYHPKGLNIIGVSSDEDKQAWRAAIDRYNLSSYPQVLSEDSTAGDDRLLFEEFENIADRYEVDAIPCFILIDSTGEIVARWQHFSEEIFSYLDTLFAK